MAYKHLLLPMLCLSFLFACRKETIEPSDIDHFVIHDSDDNLKIELTWSVNGQTDGYHYVNCDLYLSDTALMTASSFLESTSLASETDWKNAPVFYSSVGKRNRIERIIPANYRYFVDARKYLGVAVNGLEADAASLPSSFTIDYEISIIDGTDKKILKGSVLYDKSYATKTLVQYIYTLDWKTYEKYYSFRELPKPVTILRASDFTSTSVFDSKPGFNSAIYTVEFKWLVNNQDPGYTYADLDCYLITDPSTSKYIASEQNNAYEGFRIPANASFTYELGFLYFEQINNALPSPFTITYEYSIYNSMNPFVRYTYTNSFNSPPVNPDAEQVYTDLTLVQSGNTLTVAVAP